MRRFCHLIVVRSACLCIRMLLPLRCGDAAKEKGSGLSQIQDLEEEEEEEEEAEVASDEPGKEEVPGGKDGDGEAPAKKRRWRNNGDCDGADTRRRSARTQASRPQGFHLD